MNDTLLKQNLDAIRQGIELLASLPTVAYTSESPEGSHLPAIGPHFRHCLDFYVCFLDGLDLRVIDYGARTRRREVETDGSVAMRELERAGERLADLDAAILTQQVDLRREASPWAERPGEHDDVQWFGSTVGRELQFLLSHTIHHYAIIALALRLGGHPVASGFGVAPSTLEHWRREKRAAR